MNPYSWGVSAFRLMRPRQWPILTAQLAVGVILACAPTEGIAALPQLQTWPTLLAGWACWVVLLNGGTLAFNSAFDRDTGPVAYLAAPPAPPRQLEWAALGAMITGIALGFLAIGTSYGILMAACTALSWLYSHPGVRLKRRPGWDLAVNMVGYGAGTTLAGLWIGGRALSAGERLDGAAGWFTLGFAMLFGSFYPHTQIYQAEEDRARGDRTLATALGVCRSMELSLVLGLVGGASLARGLWLGGCRLWPLGVAAVAAWVVHVVVWRLKSGTLTPRDHERLMYRSLMIWAGIDLAVVIAWMA